MKRILVTLSLLFLISCGLFTENHRSVKYNLANGNEIILTMFEVKYPLLEKSLFAYVNDYPLKGRNCEDFELKNFSSKLWSEIAKRNNLLEINSGTMHLLKKQGQATPEYCGYAFSREGNGEWIQN